jgi:hypothetical protein
MSVSSAPDPLARISVGSPIYTRDYQKIGIVKETHGLCVKVGTSWLHRDYWLGPDAIRTAASDGAVMLAIDKAELGDYKLPSPPDAA